MRLEQRIVPVASPDGEALLVELRDHGDVVMLLGSAISSWEPGGLPTGTAITWTLAEKLGSGTLAKADVVQRMIANTAFEHVMECCPDEAHVRSRFARAFHPVQSNDVHRAIVRLIERGIVAHAITTNYDTGLEAAATPDLPRPVIDPWDVAGADPALPLLFKIHGCASVPKSMVFALRHERLMDADKRDLLFSLVRGRTLLVMGYSGLDFEICPELLNAGAARVVWNHFNPGRSQSDPDVLLEMTANARRVVEATDGQILWGDLCDVLKILTGDALNAKWSRTHPAFADAIVDDLSEEQADVWRMRLFNGIGCARDARAIAERVVRDTHDEGVRLDARIERARALFHMGKYRQAIQDYRSVADDLQARGDRARLPGALHGLAESCRVGGWYLQAREALNRFAALVDTATNPDEHARLEAELAFLRVLLLRNVHQVAAKTRLRPWERRLRHRALEQLRIGVPYAVETGDWPALQQGVMWADRLGISFEEIYPGTRLPLSAEQGYRQLGYHLAAMMALRDQLKRGTIRPADVREPETLIETAAEVGNYPEVWKFAAAFQRAGGVLSPEIRSLASDARRECEESPIRIAGNRLGMS